MQIAKSAACQTFTASRRDNGTLIVVEKIELHCTMETGRQSQSSSKILLLRKKWFTGKLLAVLLICMRVLYIWQAFNKIQVSICSQKICSFDYSAHFFTLAKISDSYSTFISQENLYFVKYSDYKLKCCCFVKIMKQNWS